MLTLHVIDSLSPATGGPPEAVRQLAKAYLRIGARMEVVCMDDPTEPFLADIPCPVHALGKAYLGRYRFSPRFWRWLRKNSNRFDAFVMHGIWSFSGVALRIAARRAGKPYGVFVHGALDPWFHRHYPLKHLKKRLYWPVQYSVFRDALAVFFTAESERDLAKLSFRPNEWNSVIVGLGINDPEESQPDSRAQVEEFYGRFPSLRGRGFLLFLARIHAKKGCDLLVEAFGRVAASAPDVDLVIAGPDETGLRADLEQMAEKAGIANRIHWPGSIEGNVKWGALRACDAFVLSSHSENFGIAVVESLAVGRPVLITNQVNIWPHIDSDKAGLVDDDTLEGTERLLRRWFGMTATERNAMIASTRACFQSHFTMKRTALSINELFASVTSRPVAHPNNERNAGESEGQVFSSKPRAEEFGKVT